MKYGEVAAAILELVGGKENIRCVGHSATRLRFVLSDVGKADLEGIKDIKGVIGVVDKGGQFQVIIGGEVTDVYRELTKLGDFETSSEGKEKELQQAEKKKLLSKVLETISGIFFPVIAALTGCGMLKALLALLVFLKALDTGAQTYQLLSLMSDSTFYFLPIILAVSAAKKFRCNEYMAAAIGGILIHPNFIAMVNASKEAGTGIYFLGLPVSLVSYSSSVIPTILAVWFLSYVERGTEKIVPKALRMILVPLITLLIVGPAAIVLLGPLGSICGNYLADFINLLNQWAPWLVPTLVGIFTPLLVMCGMHYGLIPIGINLLSTTGYDTVAGPGMLVSNIAQGAASLGVAIRAKNPETKSLAFSVGISAVCGITEPAMYGISLRFKRPLAATMIGGGVAGLFLGIMGVGRYAQAAPGLLALPSYIGGDSLKIFYYACAGSAIAFVVSFVSSLILGIDEPEFSQKATKTEKEHTPVRQKNSNGPLEHKTEPIFSPINGSVIPLNKVNDSAFSEGLLGQGCAIIPSDGKVYAPVTGRVVSLFPTKHAVGIVTDSGCEVLIHIGLDTVDLNGEYFTAYVEQGQTVNQGDLLIQFNKEEIQKNGYDVTTPVLITNYRNYETIQLPAESAVKPGDMLFKLCEAENLKGGN